MAVAILGHSLFAILGFGLSSSAFAFWSLVEPSIVFGRLPSAFVRLSTFGRRPQPLGRMPLAFELRPSVFRAGLWRLVVGRWQSGPCLGHRLPLAVGLRPSAFGRSPQAILLMPLTSGLRPSVFVVFPLGFGFYNFGVGL